MVYLTLFVTVGIASYALLPLLGAQVTEFGQQVPSYMAYARDQLQAWQHFVNTDRLPRDVREAIDRTFARTVDAAGDSLSHGFGGLLPLLGYLPWFMLIPVVAFFLLKDGAAFRRTILLALPRGRLRGRGAEVFEDINDALAALHARRAARLSPRRRAVHNRIRVDRRAVRTPLWCGGRPARVHPVGRSARRGPGGDAGRQLSFDQPGHVGGRISRRITARTGLRGLSASRTSRHPHASAGGDLAILSGAELAGMAGIFLAIPAVAVLSVMH
jgi:hypothetical protein